MGQLSLFEADEIPRQVQAYPRFRYMGSKYRLLPWVFEVLSTLRFDTVLDAFAGSGCVSYLLKCMGKSVTTNDFLGFSHELCLAMVANDGHRLSPAQVESLVRPRPDGKDFIRRTFEGIFFAPADLALLDTVWANLDDLPDRSLRAVALAALVRACLKRQPRGVFTVAGDPERYKDGRRDLRLSLEEHFREGVDVVNGAVFDGAGTHRAIQGDVFALAATDFDLVYLDPPYVPRADDNCYVKRYHFLEGLVSYWQAEGTEIDANSKVRKIPKRFTPFSYRRSAAEAFETLFDRFRRSTLVLSYSSNGWPDLAELEAMLARHKGEVTVHARPHRYHFGTHRGVSSARAKVQEYLIVAT